MADALFTINGYIVVLEFVRNIYPVEECDAGHEWGFKYSDGFYENFTFRKRSQAVKSHDGLVAAVASYRILTTPTQTSPGSGDAK